MRTLQGGMFTYPMLVDIRCQDRAYFKNHNKNKRYEDRQEFNRMAEQSD